MAVRYYDEALINKIKAWVKDKNMHIYDVNDTTSLFQNRADENNDKPLELPIIALSRSADVTLDYTHKRPMSFDGKMLYSTALLTDAQIEDIKNNPIKYRDVELKTVSDEELTKLKKSKKLNTSISLNAIPMKLSYQLDIYTRYADEGDEYLRNFIFNFINHPKLQINIPYNDINYPHNANVELMSTVSDNSDIDQHLFSDQFKRWTIGLSINDAYLFSAPIDRNVEGELGEVEINE